MTELTTSELPYSGDRHQRRSDFQWSDHFFRDSWLSLDGSGQALDRSGLGTGWVRQKMDCLVKDWLDWVRI